MTICYIYDRRQLAHESLWPTNVIIFEVLLVQTHGVIRIDLVQPIYKQGLHGKYSVENLFILQHKG